MDTDTNTPDEPTPFDEEIKRGIDRLLEDGNLPPTQEEKLRELREKYQEHTDTPDETGEATDADNDTTEN